MRAMRDVVLLAALLSLDFVIGLVFGHGARNTLRRDTLARSKHKRDKR